MIQFAMGFFYILTLPLLTQKGRAPSKGLVSCTLKNFFFTHPSLWHATEEQSS